MLTALLILVVLVAILSIVDGFHLMSGHCVVTWSMGLNAVASGLDLLVKAVPELLKAITE